MRIANFGGTMTFTGAPDRQQTAGDRAIGDQRIPMTPGWNGSPRSPHFRDVFNVGISFEPVQLDAQRVTLTAAVSDPNDNVTQMGFGGEYAWNEMIFVRAGYKVGLRRAEHQREGSDVKAGLGGMNAQVDFAYAAFGQLGNAGVLSLRVGF